MRATGRWLVGAFNITTSSTTSNSFTSFFNRSYYVESFIATKPLEAGKAQQPTRRSLAQSCFRLQEIRLVHEERRRPRHRGPLALLREAHREVHSGRARVVGASSHSVPISRLYILTCAFCIVFNCIGGIYRWCLCYYYYYY